VVPTKTLWVRLKRDVEELGKFVEVRALPVNAIAGQKFLEVFPALQTPACLVCLMSGDDDVRGESRNREVRWAALIVVHDPAGQAYETACDLLDTFRDEFLDREIDDVEGLDEDEDEEVIVFGSCSMRAQMTDPDFSVYQVSFRTREVNQRE